MTETDNNVLPIWEEGAASEGATEQTETVPSRDPDAEPFSRWTYADMQREFADITYTIIQNGIDKQLAVMYAYNLIENVDEAGWDKQLFTEYFMARTIYFRFVLANEIKLPPSPDARTLFNEYAALIEAWGDRHYKGLTLSGEDTERLRADSYAVLSGLTKRAIEDEHWRPTPTPRLAPREAMKLVEIISGETERLKKYLL